MLAGLLSSFLPMPIRKVVPNLQGRLKAGAVSGAVEKAVADHAKKKVIAIE